MKIAEIMEELSSKDCDLESVLLKIKILAHRTRRKKIESWANSEIDGYKPSENIPEYRRLRLILMGTIANRSIRHNLARIPILHLSKEQQESISTLEVPNGMRSLQDLVKNAHELVSPIQLEFLPLLGKTLSPGTSIIEAHVSASQTELQGIVSTVRRIILDYLLEVENVVNAADINITPATEELINASREAEASVSRSYSLGF